MARPSQTWCWYCKQEVPPQFDVCPFCTKPLDDTKRVIRCPKCGRYLLRSVDRCIQCGESFLDEPPRRQAPRQSAAPPPVEEAPATSVPGAEAPAASPVPDAGPAPDASQAPDAVPTPDAAPAPEQAQSAWGPQQANVTDDPDMLETLRTLEQLETQERHAEQSSSGKKTGVIIAVAAVLVLAIIASIFFIVRAKHRNKEPEAQQPVFCAENEHKWTSADCTHPKTCSVCGKTEGEPLGHQYEGNVCTVCGAYKNPFFFSNTGCERRSGTVYFWGDVQNYTGASVGELQLQLDLFDEDKKLVLSQPYTVAADHAIAPLETYHWEISYDDAGVRWKYWRACALDYVAAQAKP
ncbi:MAG: hypothetical protein E7425_09210 [Ruminococcaceae bacterium]|nr:hypothetical protein [Oscillospiraceae bacterium]